MAEPSVENLYQSLSNNGQSPMQFALHNSVAEVSFSLSGHAFSPIFIGNKVHVNNIWFSIPLS